MENIKRKKGILLLGFLLLFAGLAFTVIDSKEAGKIPDFLKGFLVGLGITLVLGSFIRMRLTKQKTS